MSISILGIFTQKVFRCSYIITLRTVSPFQHSENCHAQWEWRYQFNYVAVSFPFSHKSMASSHLKVKKGLGIYYN